MEKGEAEQRLFNQVQLVLESKIEEFEYYEFTKVTKEDLWAFAKRKFWKKKSFEDLQLHQVIADVYAIAPSTYMSLTQVEQFKSENWFSELKKEDLEQLLNPR